MRAAEKRSYRKSVLNEMDKLSTKELFASFGNIADEYAKLWSMRPAIYTNKMLAKLKRFIHFCRVILEKDHEMSEMSIKIIVGYLKLEKINIVGLVRGGVRSRAEITKKKAEKDRQYLIVLWHALLNRMIRTTKRKKNCEDTDHESD